MEWFIKQNSKTWKFELLVSKDFFSKEAIMRSAYKFLDLGYFFFKLDSNWDYIVEFVAKDEKADSKNIIWDFYNEILNVELRIQLEKKNKTTREKIIERAIWMSLDVVNIARDWQDANNSTIDFDKDIDEILKELENDPDLQIDKDEIERILKEIEEESSNSETIVEEKTEITLDLNWVEDAKKKFKNK